DRKKYRFMGDAAAFSYIAMEQAIADANVYADGELIYQMSDLKVGLFGDTAVGTN
ncbi:MAG: beta-ketoacyl-ACP synthase I, partial [Gammaproteobacteria bacterium]|nr:beta-ketoacyl-ACP synthase I [Gammaproteobacteria bacterium]